MAATDGSAQQAENVFHSCTEIVEELLKHPELHEYQASRRCDLSVCESPLGLSGIHKLLVQRAYSNAQQVKDDVSFCLEYWNLVTRPRNKHNTVIRQIIVSGLDLATEFERLWAQHGIDDAWQCYETASWQEQVRVTELCIW
jgi:hypothetical protein